MKPIDKAFFVSCDTSEENNFFVKWVEYLRPKHHLTATEQKVLAAILQHRWELSKNINDEKILDELTLNRTHREILRTRLSMSCPQFNGILGKLKERKIILQNKLTELYRIDPNFIVEPNENGEFKLMVIFKQVDVTS